MSQILENMVVDKLKSGMQMVQILRNSPHGYKPSDELYVWVALRNEKVISEDQFVESLHFLENIVKKNDNSLYPHTVTLIPEDKEEEINVDYWLQLDKMSEFDKRMTLDIVLEIYMFAIQANIEKLKKNDDNDD